MSRNDQKMSKDEIFKDTDAEAGSFEFNKTVADVFPDMLRRSIPGYDASIDAIGALAARYVQPGTRCYDLGCNVYVTKPIDYEQFCESIHKLGLLLSVVTLPNGE